MTCTRQGSRKREEKELPISHARAHTCVYLATLVATLSPNVATNPNTVAIPITGRSTVDRVDRNSGTILDSCRWKVKSETSFGDVLNKARLSFRHALVYNILSANNAARTSSLFVSIRWRQASLCASAR